MEAKSRGFEQALMLNKFGRISESTGANVILFRENQIVTPDINEGILPGITRKLILDFSASLGFSFFERSVNINELSNFEGIFLCGTSAEILPIKSIDKEFLFKSKKVAFFIEKYNEIKRNLKNFSILISSKKI